jgi:lipoprotein-releasing system permease protein
MRLSGRDTRAFAHFEWILALRYLRARRREGFISVLAGFSFLGILLGVFTLITVMAVMNGFRMELLNKILGLNGHIIVNKVASDFDGYDEVARRLSAIPGVRAAIPLIEGQALVSAPSQGIAGYVRGMPESGIKSLKIIADHVAGHGR